MDDDVPITVDFRIAEHTSKWVAEADAKRPYRAEVRARIANQIRGARRILELGGGPGLLAESVLAVAPAADYTLLDFAPPMLEHAATRAPNARLLLRDFLDPAWTDGLGPFDAVITMQAVHELRHKRRRPLLYRQVHDVLVPGGTFVVCDHAPTDDSPRQQAISATAAEQHMALADAGFVAVETRATIGTLYVITCRRPSA